MNEDQTQNPGDKLNGFALVRKPSSAVEKAAPGAKRILSGMVADTLALVKKETVRKSRPHRIIIVNDEEGPRRALALILRSWFPNANVQLFQHSDEASLELLETAPDLLIAGNSAVVSGGEEMVRRLAQYKVAYPIVVFSAWEMTEQWVCELAGEGMKISFLSLPFDFTSLRKALKAAGFEISHETTVPDEVTPRKTSPFRIVLVDDEDWFTEMVEGVICSRYEGVAVSTFNDPNKGWLELMQTTPDLLIVDGVMGSSNGDEIVRRLVDRKVTYPILVVSGFLDTEKWEFAEKNPQISFLPKPFTLEQLCTELSKHLAAYIHRQPAQKRPPLIVVMDENPGPVELMEVAIKHSFKNAVLQTFRDRSEGLRQLSALNPDLLIVEIVNAGKLDFKTLQSLADGKVTYPIVVTSGLEEPRLAVSAYASKGLDVTFLPKPWKVENFIAVLEAALKIARDPV